MWSWAAAAAGMSAARRGGRLAGKSDRVRQHQPGHIQGISLVIGLTVSEVIACRLRHASSPVRTSRSLPAFSTFSAA